MLGKIEDRRRGGQQRMRWLDGITDWLSGHESEQTLGDSEEQGAWRAVVHGALSWRHKGVLRVGHD